MKVKVCGGEDTMNTRRMDVLYMRQTDRQKKCNIWKTETKSACILKHTRQKPDRVCAPQDKHPCTSTDRHKKQTHTHRET